MRGKWVRNGRASMGVCIVRRAGGRGETLVKSFPFGRIGANRALSEPCLDRACLDNSQVVSIVKKARARGALLCWTKCRPPSTQLCFIAVKGPDQGPFLLEGCSSSLPRPSPRFQGFVLQGERNARGTTYMHRRRWDCVASDVLDNEVGIWQPAARSQDSRERRCHPHTWSFSWLDAASLLLFLVAAQLVMKAPFADRVEAFHEMMRLISMYNESLVINVYYATPPVAPTRVFIVSNCKSSAYTTSQDCKLLKTPFIGQVGHASSC